MIHTKEETYTIYNQSCLDLMDSMDENSIDCIITDPPYEIGFMGKSWDSTGIAFDVETWKKALRVLKPGGYLLAFNHSRTFHRMMVAIEDAGFELRDTTMYLYGSGFPKSHNIGKALKDTYGGVIFAEETKQDSKHNMRLMSKTNISKTINTEDKQRQILFKSMSKQSIYGTMQGEESKEIIKNGKESCLERWNYLQAEEGQLQKCKICKMSTKIYLDGKERWLCGRTQIDPSNEYWKMFNINRSCSSYKPQSNRQRDTKLNVVSKQYITQEIRGAEQNYEQYGTALKPAFEPIVMAMKPIKGTFAENALKYGVGGINIDECRIPFENSKNPATNPLFRKNNQYKTEHGIDKNSSSYSLKKEIGEMNINDQGRWPANIIHDGSEEAISGFPNSKGASSQNFNEFNMYKGNALQDSKTTRSGFKKMYDDEGSAARYFYTAKASVKDRDEGLEDTNIPYGRRASLGGSDNDKEIIDDVSERFRTQPRKNIHPTVKPTELLQYLTRLVAPKGSTIFDMFMGSGSGGKAAMIENVERNANYHFIGVDLSKEYCDISKARIEWGINFKVLEDTHILYDEKGESHKVIQDKFNLFGDD